MDRKIVMLGIDSSKSIFQCHGVNAAGQCVFRKRLRRNTLIEFVANLPKCAIVAEACGGAHYLARKFRSFGHEARLIAPQYVKPFVKSNKDDAADAEAIVEAASRPHMHFVPIKQVWQQDLQGYHRVRQRLIRNKTALTNEIRGLLFEYGVAVAQGDSTPIKKLPELLANESDTLTEMTKALMQDLFSEFVELKQKIAEYESKLEALGKKGSDYRRLNGIRGFGLITTAALTIALADPRVFKNGRHFAAWLGLVPKHIGTGGFNRNRGISKRGDSYLRNLPIHGARATVYRVRLKATKNESLLDPLERWVFGLYERKGTNRAAVALANKNARIAWALTAHGHPYDVKLASSFSNGEAA